jgi:hypothetical protein
MNFTAALIAVFSTNRMRGAYSLGHCNVYGSSSMMKFAAAFIAVLSVLVPDARGRNAVPQEGNALQNSPMMFRGSNLERRGATVRGAPDGQTVTAAGSVVGGRCDYSDPTDNPSGYHGLCIDAKNATIRLDVTKMPPLNTFKIEINGTVYEFPVSVALGGSDAVVGNNGLKTITGAPGKRITRLGFYSPGDGGLAMYNWSSVNCPQADDGTQPTEVTGCWLADFSIEAPSIKVWGAKCDGATDDAPAITKAFLSSAKTISGPDVGVCRTSATVIVPGGSTLRGRNSASMGTNASTPGGFTIKCDLTTNPCIRLDGDNNQSALINVGVDRAAGAIPGGTVGVQLYGGMYTILENVGIYRQSIGIQLYDRASFFGLYAVLNRVLTCSMTESHIEINGWRETRVNQSRFGCNGALDVANRQYVRITGGHGDGPNTVYFVNSQFNHGSGLLADCLVRWENLGGGQDGPTSGWVFNGIHVEQAKSAFCSDASMTVLNGLQVSNSKFYGGFEPNASFFRLNPGTIPSSLNLTGNQIIAWGDVTLAPAAQMNGVIMLGNEFITTGAGIQLTGIGHSVAALTGNRWQNMSLAGNWGGLSVNGTGVVKSNTAKGFVSIEVPGYTTATVTTLFDCVRRLGHQE